jgi:hypothetical protein
MAAADAVDSAVVDWGAQVRGQGLLWESLTFVVGHEACLRLLLLLLPPPLRVLHLLIILLSWLLLLLLHHILLLLLLLLLLHFLHLPRQHCQPRHTHQSAALAPPTALQLLQLT